MRTLEPPSIEELELIVELGNETKHCEGSRHPAGQQGHSDAGDLYYVVFHMPCHPITIILCAGRVGWLLDMEDIRCCECGHVESIDVMEVVEKA